MEVVNNTNLMQSEIIMELLDLLKKNSMSEEANHAFELCAYVDSLEKKLDSMTDELTSVKEQLKNMQEDTMLNHLKAQVQTAAENLQERCNLMKEQLFSVKEHMKSKATELVGETKRIGKAALNKISEFFGVKDKLISIRNQVEKSQRTVSSTIAKIDEFGTGLREANQKIANTFRTFADKDVVDYAQKERTFSKTELVKKPWVAKERILDAMKVRLDRAIDKCENLSKDVEIDGMMKRFDKLMGKTQEEEKGVLVGEAEARYGADVFEASENGKGEMEINTDRWDTGQKKRGNSR